MNSWIRKWTVLTIVVTASVLNGCALLSPEVSDEERYANDPVARAALALRSQRSPASEADQASIKARSFSAERALSNQLTLGMTPSQVRSIWGQPQEVENAGDPSSGNQRWTYLNGLKRDWGTSNYRVVYFEQNQVVGWENHR